MKKIVFDASDLCAAQADGTTRYTAELLQRLPALSHDTKWLWAAQCDAPNVPHIIIPSGTNWIGKYWSHFWTQSRFPLELFRQKPDVLFMPIQQLPMIRPRRMKTVAVIHDLAYFEYPEQTKYKDWLLLHAFGAQAIREADALIAVSQATANDIKKYYGRTNNVHVVHHGVNHDQFYVPTSDKLTKSWRALEKEYPRLKKPFLLFVGQIQPRKNIERLIEAFEKLHAKDNKLQLAIAGAHGWLQEPIFERIQQSTAANHIELLGRVPDELLAPLYWNAETYVLPSLYEGFGMPILEAMASGCPVVTSEGSATGEVAADAAVLIDPLSVNSIVTGIAEARRKRSDLTMRGVARSQEFTWERTAQKTLEIIESL